MTITLVMRTAVADERPFPIRKRRTTIGRGVRSDVRIPIPSVAANHCELILTEAGLSVRDLGSPEGTLLNGRRVGEAVLRHSDQLTVGSVTFEVRVAAEEAPAPATLTEVKLARRASERAASRP